MRVSIPWLLASATFFVAASAAATTELTATAVTSGGGRSASAHYVLQGSLGQAAASAVSTSATHELTSGLRRRRGTRDDAIFNDGFE